MKERASTTVRVDIFMAGDLEQAKLVCREFCFAVGLCVHIEPLTFIYTGGEEAGFKVGLVNYPRFPKEAQEIEVTARQLADVLMRRLFQHSYSIVGPDETVWVSRRPE